MATQTTLELSSLNFIILTPCVSRPILDTSRARIRMTTPLSAMTMMSSSGSTMFEIDQPARFSVERARLYTLAGTALEAIVCDVASLSVAVFGNGYDLAAASYHGHVHDGLVLVYFHASHALSLAPHSAHFLLGEAYALARAGRNEYLVIAARQRHTHKLVALVERYGNFSHLAYGVKLLYIRLFDKSALGRHKQISAGVFLAGNNRRNLFRRRPVEAG